MLSSRRRITASRAKPHAGELRALVLLPQRLDRAPVEVAFPGNIPDGALASAPSHVAGNAFGIEGVARQEVEPLPLHLAATLARHATHLDRQEGTRVATREVANAPRASVVAARLESSTTSADGFLAS